MPIIQDDSALFVWVDVGMYVGGLRWEGHGYISYIALSFPSGKQPRFQLVWVHN